MYLCISGFLLDGADDDSIKFELDLDSSFNEKIMRLLGHKSLNAMAEGEWLLSREELEKISELIEQPLPTHLKMFIGLEE
ncbi:MAG: pyocin S6 family toxin immunity protein [Pseudomonas gingeri]